MVLQSTPRARVASHVTVNLATCAGTALHQIIGLFARTPSLIVTVETAWYAYCACLELEYGKLSAWSARVVL